MILSQVVMRSDFDALRSAIIGGWLFVGWSAVEVIWKEKRAIM